MDGVPLGHPEPFVSLTATNFETTQQQFVIRGKVDVIREVQRLLFAPKLALVPSGSVTSSQ